VQELEALKKSQQERITELLDTLRNSSTAKHSDTEHALRRLEIDLEAAKREKESFKSYYERLANEAAELRVKLETLEVDHDAGKRASYAPSPARSVQLQQAAQHLEDDGKQQRTAQDKERIRGLENQLQTETMRRQQAEEEVQQLRAELERARASHADDGTVEELRRQVVEAKTRLAEAQRDRREMEAELESLREEVAASSASRRL
jgi:chromosome segregation ATPase